MNVLDLEFPDDLHYLVEHQVWARPEPRGRVRVGITAMGVLASGELYMCRPKRVGTEVEQGFGIGVAELAKSVVSVKSPVSGIIVEINEALEERPELVHQDPYGAGWIACVEARDWPGDAAALVCGEPVVEAMREYARQNRIGR